MPNAYHINDTTLFHRERMQTLGWELTVCNALEGAASPCRSIIHKKAGFGELLYDQLACILPLPAVSRFIEIGGGYGFITRDFLARCPAARATMLDLSPVLLERQKQTLAGAPVEFLHDDFFSVHGRFFASFDLVLMNEIIGDFPTACDIDPACITGADMSPDPVLSTIRRIFSAYGFPVPGRRFNLNIGAIEAVEKLCSAGVRNIYLSEHSCEASVSDDLRDILHVPGPGNPERIPLMGHDEYTIKFSYLEKVARAFGYRTVRGQYKDFITFDRSGRLRFILTSNSQKDEHEIIRQFIEDLYKYEYLVLMRD